MAKRGRPRSYSVTYEGDEGRACDFGDREDFTPHAVLSQLQTKASASFSSENEYREWFVHEALPDLAPHLGKGAPFARVDVEVPLTAGGVRIDLLAKTDADEVFGFELKAASKKHPTTAGHALMQGVGQALLYHDILSIRSGRSVPVFLVSDFVSRRVAAVLLRHGLFVGLVEANRARIICLCPGAAQLNG